MESFLKFTESRYSKEIFIKPQLSVICTHMINFHMSSHMNAQCLINICCYISISMPCTFVAPTAVRNIRTKPAGFTRESIFICWDHPEYPNSQLSTYIVYSNKQDTKQSTENLSIDGYKEDILMSTMASYNLTGLKAFTYYSILVTARSEGGEHAPLKVEILNRTNATGKLYVSCITKQEKVY